MVTKDEILVILETFIHSENSDYENTAYTHGLNDAAEAVVEFVEKQPVNRVRAMAALIELDANKNYFVPDMSGVHQVVCLNKGWSCWYPNGYYCSETIKGDDECIHVQAVKLYQEQNK